MNIASDMKFFSGDRCLNHFPPTAATSLCVLFLISLWYGETVLVDPVISEGSFYHQLLELKPNVAVHTGSAWEVFFEKIEKDIKNGKTIDLSYAKSWVIGGEGTDKEKNIFKMDKTLQAIFQNEIDDFRFTEYEGMLPYSPTTYKKDCQRMIAMENGYLCIKNENVIKRSDD